jgi:type IV pilus assembly protein PilV
MNNRFQSGPVDHKNNSQTGIALLEVLIAILVFSLGLLMVIGIQAASIKMAADAQLRTKAALLAGRLVGQMWANDGGTNDLKAKFESPDGAAYKNWFLGIRGVRDTLPGVVEGNCGDGDDAVCVSTQPTVVVNGLDGANNGQVVITLYWKTPSMKPEEEPHRHIVTSQISRNP